MAGQKGKSGRKPKDVNAAQVEKLIGIGCTVQDVADFFDVNIEVILRRFPKEITRGRVNEKISLRRARMIRAINDKSDYMLIYLSKIRLKESERYPPADELDPSKVTDEHGNSIDP